MRSGNRRVHGRSAAAFTMIEAIVSLAVVLMAVAALLPVMSEARIQVISSACQANQLGLGIGVSSYITDYSQLPGINSQEGTYWAKPWGQPYMYGGVQSWMAQDLVYPIKFGISDGTRGTVSGYSGIGYVYPYIGGTDDTDVGASGRGFYCPGTAKSFGDGQWSWYNTWTGDYPGDLYRFGEVGTGTVIVLLPQRHV